jgi:hypothetical protein
VFKEEGGMSLRQPILKNDQISQRDAPYQLHNDVHFLVGLVVEDTVIPETLIRFASPKKTNRLR